MVRKLVEALRRQDWLTVLIELAVVVLGIFLALQADSWNDARLDRAREGEYIIRLRDALENDAASYERCLRIARRRRESGEWILDSLVDPDLAAARPAEFFKAVRTAGWTYFPLIDDVAFEELKFNGELGIISDVDLRSKLVRYYSSVHWRHQFDGIRLESTNIYRAYLGRLLLAEEEYRMVDGEVAADQDLGLASFTDVEALALVERIRSNPDYISDIPILTSQRGIRFTCMHLQARVQGLLEMLPAR